MVHYGNKTMILPARRVVLAAGGIGTPSILLASDAPSKCEVIVGRDMQEHWGFGATFSLDAPCSLDGPANGDGSWAASITPHIAFIALLGTGRPNVQVVLEPSCCV